MTTHFKACPACRAAIPREATACPECGHDFEAAGQMLCVRCLETARPEVELRGNIAIALFLALFLILPAIIYWAWASGKRPILRCPSCGSEQLVPLESERARRLLEAGRA